MNLRGQAWGRKEQTHPAGTGEDEKREVSGLEAQLGKEGSRAQLARLGLQAGGPRKLHNAPCPGKKKRAPRQKKRHVDASSNSFTRVYLALEKN